MIGIGLAAGLAALGAAIGNGLIVNAALTGMSRQPDMESKLRMNMIIGVAMVEGLAIIAIVIAFIMVGKV
ncbi:MAG: ATP synthase F0 subunit C [Lactobacillales bacterium]|nr:ATP synthase F0 subunit C [Lactobacillales bacterium]